VIRLLLYYLKQWNPLITISILVSFLLIADLQASHIRAGEIIARRIDNFTFTYEFIFIGYRDNDTGVRFGNGTFDFGDGDFLSGPNSFIISETQISANIFRAEFRLVHTFQAPNSYVVSYQEDWRNEGISNMINSGTTSFYVETLIVIDPFFGINNTPILTVPPIDEGSPGVIFIHNAGAFDPDGDSLSYSFTSTKQSKNQDVNGYQVLNSSAFYTSFFTASESGGPATLTLDSKTGDLIWDTPGDRYRLTGNQCPNGVDECSEYNIAFRIEEWRKLNGVYYSLGYVSRDMQIIIYEGDNDKPELVVPEDICVVAGEIIQENIQGVDPDGHRVKFEAFGGPFEINGSATYSPNPAIFQNSPGTLQFHWQTVCGHVRERSYEVQYKITDDPIENGVKVGPSLVNFETWEVTVIGPKPSIVNAQPETGRSVRLNWNTYECSNASAFEIWRRVGSSDFTLEDCQVGIPAGNGFVLVGNVPANQNTYVDSNLAPGGNYCYRIVALFPEPGRGQSIVSDEVCITLLSDAPVITKVDIGISDTDGVIAVQWTSPLEIDPTQFPPPFTYSLFQSNGLQFQTPILVADNLADTSFTVTNIDTEIRGYSYRLAMYDSDGNFVDSSAVASTVRLDAQPLLQAIEISWTANVPWSNRAELFPYHYIFRDNVNPSNLSQLVLIDSVFTRSGPFSYFDDGSFNNQIPDENTVYCYFVTTYGSYSNPILPEPLINRSQKICAQPNDNVPPCSPIGLRTVGDFDCATTLADVSCEFDRFSNQIQWVADPGATCDDDIVLYRIYFSATGRDEDYVLIESVPETSYRHENLSSFKGCYKISAVDRSGNVSPQTQAYCIDNCPYFELPNVFTPNGDGINDTFTPFFSGSGNLVTDFDRTRCPRFILSVDFKVFDRTGKEVYDFQSARELTILINWAGNSTNGRELPSGVYFYSSKVIVDQLDPSTSEKNYKGWVQLLR